MLSERRRSNCKEKVFFFLKRTKLNLLALCEGDVIRLPIPQTGS